MVGDGRRRLPQGAVPPGAVAYGQAGGGAWAHVSDGGDAAMRGQQRVAVWKKAACKSSNESSCSGPDLSVAAERTRVLCNQHSATQATVICGPGRHAPRICGPAPRVLVTQGPGSRHAPLRFSKLSARRGMGPEPRRHCGQANGLLQHTAAGTRCPGASEGHCVLVVCLGRCAIRTHRWRPTHTVTCVAPVDITRALLPLMWPEQVLPQSGGSKAAQMAG